MNSNLILFDGVCNFCNFWVNFLIDHDDKRYFKFASLQSNIAQRILIQKKIDTLQTDSVILVMNEKVFFKSSAALLITKNLNGFWKMLYIFSLIPSPLRDLIYDFVAKNRYKWFGKSETCRVPSKDEKERFLS
jgi:predicted DCC family thiol-disulfide oxidoreductase YuxK